MTFSVDAMEAGEGTLELVISTQQSTVKAEVVACSRGLYDVTFVPHQLAPHFVNITFNDEDVPGITSPLVNIEVYLFICVYPRHLHFQNSWKGPVGND